MTYGRNRNKPSAQVGAPLKVLLTGHYWQHFINITVPKHTQRDAHETRNSKKKHFPRLETTKILF